MPREAFTLPHFQVGEARVEFVQGKGTIAAYKSSIATTACSLERETTLCTRNHKLVRCPECLRVLTK